MSTESKAKRALIAVGLWVLIFAIGGVCWKLLIAPHRKNKLAQETGSISQYSRGELLMSADGFSGYAVLRSPQYKQRLKDAGIKLVVKSDSANYLERLQALKKGDIVMAPFPVNSLITAGTQLGEFPVSIVAIIDQTVGSDGAVAYEEAFPNLQALNNPETELFLVKDSPNELIARILVGQFAISIPEEKWIWVDGAEDVLKELKRARRTDKKLFFLWDPELSIAKGMPGVKCLLDTSKMQGWVIDAFVVRRDFLRDHPDLVTDAVECYLRTLYSYQNEPDGMVKLVLEDAKINGKVLSEQRAQDLVKGIRWANTSENYAYLGLLSGQEAKGIQNLEDSIINISRLLLKTGGLKSNPLAGKESTLFYNKTLADLKDKAFHPGRSVNILADQDAPKMEDVRGVEALPELTIAQWGNLSEVVEMRIEPISFGRGKASLTMQGRRDLDELVRSFRTWTKYYLKVVGHASAIGDADANFELAQKRADAVVEYLISGGVNESRVKALAQAPQEEGAEQQSVTFILCERP